MTHTLRSYSYFGTGGTCADLYVPKTAEQARLFVEGIHKKQQRSFVLGGGTNSLVSDEPWDGAVIVVSELLEMKVCGTKISVGAGVENTALSNFALTLGLGGAEFMNRLPGKIGGTVRMNARCYGGEISQIVETVKTVSPDGKFKEWPGPAVFRGYKDTNFMTNGHLVVSCVMGLQPGEVGSIAAKMKHCEDDRVKKHQFDHPSCGCVFKNNYGVGVPSGVLLDHSGAKRLVVGGAVVSPQHANFIFNHGASSRDVLELSLKMRDAVWQKFGAWLEYEMEVLGDLPKDLEILFKEKRPHALNVDQLAPLKAMWTPKL